MENKSKLNGSNRSNGFGNSEINGCNEHNLDGIEMKEKQEMENCFVAKDVEKGKTHNHFDESCQSKSIKHLATHSYKICHKVKNIESRIKLPVKPVLQNNISVKCQIVNSKEISDSKKYKLRTRSLSKNKSEADFSENKGKKEMQVSLVKKPNTCAGCGMTFSNKTKLLNHKTENTSFQCSNCKKCFCSSNSLDIHLKLCATKVSTTTMKHEAFLIMNTDNLRTNFFECLICNSRFTDKKTWVSHILNDDCSCANYVCGICGKTFIHKKKLKKHIVAQIKNQFQCQFKILEHHKGLNNHNCDIGIKNKNCYSKSCNSKTQPNINCSKNIMCTLCCKPRFLESDDNQSSKVLHSADYKCQICKKIYKNIVTYKNHLSSHGNKTTNNLCRDKNLINYSKVNCQSGTHHCHISCTKNKEKPKYECDTCKKSFTKLVKLKVHILNIHQGVNYQCKKCNIKFLSQEELEIHTGKEDCKPEDLCVCQTCKKVFAKRDYLKKHQYKHTNIFFKCKYCYCAFMKEKSYKRHVEKMNCSKSARKIRMAEFNYKKCRLCEVEYETEELLIEHFKASHVGLLPHQCFCCDSCLPTFQDLQSHIHQHNIQKYTCNLCGKPYTSQEGFRKHRLKHKGAEFKCKFCNSEFLNENRFKLHEKTCKKNPDTGYEPSQEKDKPRRKGDKPKQSRQLHWESRIIMKHLRGDPKQENTERFQPRKSTTSAFFDEQESDIAEAKGWFNSYYKTDEDDIAFGLKNRDDIQGCDSDFDVSEFLQTDRTVKRNKTSLLSSSTDNAVATNMVENDEIDTVEDNYSEKSSEDSSTDSDEEVIGTDLPIDYDPKKCRLCVITFNQECELLHHFIKNHPREHAHKCPQCEVQSPLYAQLKEHLKTHGIGIGIFNCDNCSKQFKSEKKVTSHKKRCKGISDRTNGSDRKLCLGTNKECCKKCGKKFHSKLTYRKHKKLCKKRKDNNENKEKFNGAINKSSSKEEEISDSLPDGNNIHFSTLEDDIIEANNETILDTKLNKTVAPKNSPNVSSATNKSIEEEKKNEVKGCYIGEPPLDSFPCRLCDKKFQYERGIVMHFKSTHPGHKPLICHVCNMHLADKLKEHLKTHGIGEEFICELCGKRFNQKFLSKIHEMWHQGIEYKCDNCKQKFLNKEKMDKHVKENRCSNRQSLMRLPCDICGKTYRSKFGLNKHYITHTPKELRPVKNRMNCEYCGKWFEYNNGLQRHRRIHTGERPFCCRFCPKAFAQEGNCKAHERIHTGESKSRKKKKSSVVESSDSSQISEAVELPPQIPALSAQFPSLPPEHPSSLPAQIPSLPTQISSVPAQLSTLPAQMPSLPTQLTTLPAQLTTMPAQLTTLPAQLTTLPAQLPTFPADLTSLPPSASPHISFVSAVETVTYPTHINLYIINNISPNGIAT